VNEELEIMLKEEVANHFRILIAAFSWIISHIKYENLIEGYV
jgi:hypothetical protein